MTVVFTCKSFWDTEVIIRADPNNWRWKYGIHGFNIISFMISDAFFAWYLIAVRSMARQVKEGTLSADNPKGVVDTPQTTTAQVVQATIVAANPVSTS